MRKHPSIADEPQSIPPVLLRLSKHNAFRKPRDAVHVITLRSYSRAPPPDFENPAAFPLPAMKACSQPETVTP